MLVDPPFVATQHKARSGETETLLFGERPVPGTTIVCQRQNATKPTLPQGNVAARRRAK
jgi:hypothetical protein